MNETGELIDGRFRLKRSIGSGGMGVVYLAIDEETDRQVAVKVLRAAVVHSLEARLRLSREIEVLARLRSPYIAELYSAGYLSDESPYFVMEYLEGRDLKAELRRRGPLPFAEAAAYLVQACRGVATAHAQGIVHRDLKPHNLIVTRLDAVRQVKIVDFGVAKILSVADQGLTASDSAVGTPLYMCPEQLLNPKSTSTLADVWALGVILYETLAGFSPFADDSPGSVVAAVTLDEPVPIRQVRPDLPDALVQLIDLALVKVPTKRLPSVEEFEQRLLPIATPLEALVVSGDAAERFEGTIERPPRVRGEFDLRRAIRTTVDAAPMSQADTLRRVRPASERSPSLPGERLSLLPNLQRVSRRTANDALLSAKSQSGLSSRSNTSGWSVNLLQNRTAVAATLMVVGIAASMTLLLLWRSNHASPSSPVLHVPSRPAPMLASVPAPTESALASIGRRNPFDGGAPTAVSSAVEGVGSVPGTLPSRLKRAANEAQPVTRPPPPATSEPAAPLVPLHL